MKTCSVKGCIKKVWARGYCEMHYWRVRRHGDTEIRLRRANGEGQIHRGHFLVSRDGRQVGEHILIAERALGHPLPKRAVVHHVNENGLDNRNENLVICEDQGYHNVIHGRLNAYRATGDANAKPCRVCHVYERDVATALVRNGTSHYHRRCAAREARKYRKK